VKYEGPELMGRPGENCEAGISRLNEQAKGTLSKSR
jgi:hypothetical protein